MIFFFTLVYTVIYFCIQTYHTSKKVVHVGQFLVPNHKEIVLINRHASFVSKVTLQLKIIVKLKYPNSKKCLINCDTHFSTAPSCMGKWVVILSSWVQADLMKGWPKCWFVYLFIDVDKIESNCQWILISQTLPCSYCVWYRLSYLDCILLQGEIGIRVCRHTSKTWFLF